MANFQKTLGHKKQKDFFLKVSGIGRLAHGYALVGPESIGKTTFARELASLLGADPVLDVLEADARELTVEQARDVRARLALAAAGQTKVAIISQAEALSSATGNALLKVLEEPPANSLLFLVTANFQALLPTLASRVQRVNFSIVSDREVGEAIGDNTEIVALARGRIGIAKKLFESPEALEFFKLCQKHYQVMNTGTLVQRLQSAEEIASWETPEINSFLRVAMETWAQAPKHPGPARKLLEAVRDVRANLNSRLLLDNLFLPI